MGADHDQHRPFEDLAVRHVVGALDAAEASAFRSHLLDCGECRARVGELRSIDSALADVERSERRARAVQRVETKQRESDDAPPPESLAGPAQGQRGVMIAGLVLIIILSVWNFVLRGQTDGMRAALTAEREASAVINFGQAWDPVTEAIGVSGVARIERGSLAVMVQGTDDAAPYRIRLTDARGAVLHDTPALSEDGQVWYYLSQAPNSAVQVDVTLDRGDGDTIVFRAEESAEDPADPGDGQADLGDG